MGVTSRSTYTWDAFNPSKPYITITSVIKWSVKFEKVESIHVPNRFQGPTLCHCYTVIPVISRVLTPLIGVKWPQVPNYVRPFIIGAHLADEGSGAVLQPYKMFATSSWPWLLSFFMIWGLFFFKENGSNEETVACSQKIPADALYKSHSGANWGGAEIPSCKWDILTPVNPRSPSPQFDTC